MRTNAGNRAADLVFRRDRDFVEAPSQMLVEWIYDYDTLKTFATKADGEVIPRALVEKMNRARRFGVSSIRAIRTFQSALSLSYHSGDPANIDLMKDLIALEERYSAFPHHKDTHFYANFGHLNGYSAIYYSYLWAEVIAADMFSEFEKHGVRNKEVAARYRDLVLMQGGMKPAAEMVTDFLGRPYSFEPFAKSLAGDDVEKE